MRARQPLVSHVVSRDISLGERVGAGFDLSCEMHPIVRRSPSLTSVTRYEREFITSLRHDAFAVGAAPSALHIRPPTGAAGLNSRTTSEFPDNLGRGTGPPYLATAHQSWPQRGDGPQPAAARTTRHFHVRVTSPDAMAIGTSHDGIGARCSGGGSATRPHKL
jgi:hypothetical protein